MEKYSIKEMYGKIRGVMESVNWGKLVWSNYGAPRWLFILYLAWNTRLAKWVLVESLIYPLCRELDEDIDHLFFACRFSGIVWCKLLQW